MSTFGMLLRFARQVVLNVMSQLTQQVNVIEEQAMNPMRQMIQAVVNGVWIGEGANAFVEEVSTLFIPGIGRVAETINIVNNNISNAIDILEQADQQVTALVNGLGDLFGGIY
ncbi:MAG TPA: hypothetical protein ENJ35_04465 [Gammaproteobacteria bacterium]|nr:hypothetical protein [Gammaproteobacteria bacterium]